LSINFKCCTQHKSKIKCKSYTEQQRLGVKDLVYSIELKWEQKLSLNDTPTPYSP